MQTETLRHADRDQLLTTLRTQHQDKYDVIVPANQLRYEGGRLFLAGHGVELTLDGVAVADLTLEPTSHFESQLATRLGIPQAFFRGHRPGHVGQLDQMVNYWLSTQERNVMVRSFRNETTGTARAVMSDRYLIIDHLDFMGAVRKGIEQSGRTCVVDDLNLTGNKLRMDFVCPGVTAVAGDLLKGYTSPFSGNTGNENPIVQAGFRVSNSEVGSGRGKVDPWAKFLVCDNGMTITKFASDLAVSRTHRGAQLLEGAVQASGITQAKAIELLVAQVTDSVQAFLDPEWFQGTIAKIETAGQRPLEPGQAVETIARVSNKLHFTAEEADLILSDFIAGTQLTNGGVMQAITATAQRLNDPERAAHLQERALDALALA